MVLNTAVFKMESQQGAGLEHRQLLDVAWRPGGERSVGEQGRVSVYG